MTHIAVAVEPPPFMSRRIPPRFKRRLRRQMTARAVFVATLVTLVCVGLITSP